MSKIFIFSTKTKVLLTFIYQYNKITPEILKKCHTSPGGTISAMWLGGKLYNNLVSILH
jgi:hypothetical protein